MRYLFVRFNDVLAIGAIAAAMLIARPTSAATLSVRSGGDLQSALINARPGDVITLEAGATFTGSFTLPNKEGASTITVRTAPGPGVPEPGTRIDPTQAQGLAKLRAPAGQSAIQTAPGAHHWRLQLLEVSGSGQIDLIALGSGSQRALSEVPHDLELDTVYVHGDPSTGQRRCIALNSASTKIANSYVSDCKWVGQDAQAIAGWNGPGPFTITNNYLEGSTENVMFGGADPSIPNLVPSDIVVSGNLMSKPVAWRTEKWQVKNIFELKNARRVTVEGNTFENCWTAAQSGFAILFTVRNQDGQCPWCTVEDVTFAGNIVQHSAAGVQILGYDDSNRSQQTHGITIRNNLFADIDGKSWSGSGYALLLVGGPRDIKVDHNTFIQSNSSGIIQVDGPPILGFTFTNNIGRQGAYGVIGSDHAPGNDTITAFFPGAQFTGNVIADADPSKYPRGNRFPSESEFERQFVSYSNGDYRLAANSSWRNAGTDGLDLGMTGASETQGIPHPLPPSTTRPIDRW